MYETVKIEEFKTHPKAENTLEQSILEPEHPLLVQFQEALKQYLLSQIENAKAEVYDLETETKKKNVELETIGLQLYQSQQHVCSQQEVLGHVMKNVERMKETSDREEEDVRKNRNELKDAEERLFESEKSIRELSKEISAVTELNCALEKSENRIEDQIQLSRRIASKRRVENETVSKEKKKQDYLLQTLVNEMWKIESEIESLQLEMKVKEGYVEDMEGKISIANTNISAIQTEYKALIHSWNAVIVSIGQRDRGLNCLTDQLARLKENLATLTSGIELVNKQTKKQMLQNERLTGLGDRIFRDNENHQSTYQKDLRRKEELEKDMGQLKNIITETEKQMLIVVEECKDRQTWYDELQREFEKIAGKKVSIQSEIEKVLVGDVSNGKIGKRLVKTLNGLGEKRRFHEVTLRQVLNKKSTILTEIEKQQLINEELFHKNEDANQQIVSLNKETDKLKSLVAAKEILYTKRKTNLQNIKEKLTAVQEKKHVDDFMSREDIQIMELEKSVRLYTENIKELQQSWLVEQNRMINVSEERQDQIKTIDILRKETLLQKQKNLRICDELEDIKRRKRKIESNIKELTAKSARLCEVVFKKRGQKQHLNKDNIFLKSKYDASLEAAEIELLKIESEISEIEEEKLTLSKSLIEINRRGLAWETQYMLAKETKENSKEERDKGGDFSVLRKDINKKTMTLGQLRGHQKKLLHNLQMCISTRDSIFYKSEAKQRIAAPSKSNKGEEPRMHFIKKIPDLKNKRRQLKLELEKTKEKIKPIEKEIKNRKETVEETKEASMEFDLIYAKGKTIYNNKI